MTNEETQHLAQNVASIAGDMKLAMTYLKQHHKDLHGNGRAGLLHRITRVETILCILGGVLAIGLPIILSN